jgi:hypothetical protein
MNLKNVITWKDADQNLCTLAAALIDSSLAFLHAPENKWIVEDATELDELIPDIFSPKILPDEPTDTTGRTFKRGTWSTSDTAPIWSHRYLSPQCHYAFMNMIRLALKHQRLMLKRNLMGQDRRHRISGQSSRNATGRKQESKYGRKPER